MAVNRLNLHKAKKAEQSIKEKKEIGELLEKGKTDLARVRVSFIFLVVCNFSQTISIIMEDYTIQVMQLIEIYCQTILSRMDLIEASKYFFRAQKNVLIF